MKVVAEAKSYRVKCPCCLSIIEFQREDIQDCLHLGSLYFQWVKCPVCHDNIYVASRGAAGATNQFEKCVEAIYKENVNEEC